MPDDTARDELDRLRASHEALAAELAALRRRFDQPKRRRALLPALALALLVALVPAAILAANPFVDLNPGSVHNANIDAIYQAGITTGCDPTHYCPNDFVTREQMASFLARTAGLGANPPVANAAQLGGVPAAGYLQRGAADFAVLATYQVTGPLPKSFEVTSHGSALLLFVSGSAYGTDKGAIGVQVEFDGAVLAYLQVSVNETLSHKALAPLLLRQRADAGVHTIALTTLNTGTYHTGTDNYDVFNLTVIELPLD